MVIGKNMSKDNSRMEEELKNLRNVVILLAHKIDVINKTNCLPKNTKDEVEYILYNATKYKKHL